MTGYQPTFISDTHKVCIPAYHFYATDTAVNKETGKNLLPYIYFSVLQHKKRRLPILTASNIYRTAFTSSPRSGTFKKEARIADREQLSSEDYSTFNTIKKAAIEKGHMVKREDVQWDEINDAEKSMAAAKSTFYYTNAVPQHDSLNNGVWKLLENSIIIKGRVPMPAKVCVFTGPVLDAEDPLIVSNLADQSTFRIPVLFWKVIYYTKSDNKLYAAAFLMGQLNPLKRDKIISLTKKRAFQLQKKPSSLKPFLEFEEDEKYQVPVSLIENLTQLQFHPAIDLHKNEKPLKLIMKDVQIRSYEKTIFSHPVPLIENINV